MRLASVAGLAILVAAMAGCVAPEPEEANPLFGLCPQWQQGPGQFGGSAQLDAATPAAGQVVAPEMLHLGDRPFDMLRLRLDNVQVADGVGATGATLSLRAMAGNGSEPGATVNLWDFRAASAGQARSYVPVVHFTPGTAAADEVVQAFLTSAAHDEPAKPGPIRLEWRLQGNGTASVAYTATFHYKVCGAALGNAVHVGDAA